MFTFHHILFFRSSSDKTWLVRQSSEQFIGFSFLLYSREEWGKLKLPAQTTAMFQGGEEQEGLAKCKALWDP